MARTGCQAARGDMEALLDGRLPERRARTVRAHVEGCAACGAEYAALDRLHGRLRALPAEPLPADFALHLHRRLAAASPAEARRPWGAILAFPAATALAGFLVAAVLARPMLRPRSLGASADAAGAAVAANALERATGTGSRVPIGSVTPALFPVQAAGTSESSGTAGAAGGSAGAAASGATSTSASGGAQGMTAAPNIPFASGSPQNALGAPAAVSMTLVASSPQEALATLSDLVVGSGGRVVTTFLGSAGAGAAGAGTSAAGATAGGGPSASAAGAGAPSGGPQPVATVDAVVPEGAVQGYDQAARGLGTLLALVNDVPASAPATAPVRMIVTILSVSAAPAAAAASASQASSAAGRIPAASAARAGRWQERVLLDAARAAPWAGGVLAAGLLAWGADRLRRRGRWA